MLHRHVEWAKNLARGGCHEFWVLVDETHGCSASQRLETIAIAAGAKVHCFAYTQDDMQRTFPVLTELYDALPNSSTVKDCFTLPCLKSLAWGIHTEAILLWWRSLSEWPSTVWVFEDDAGFSGDILGFILDYKDDTRDLLAHGIQPVEVSWVWRDTASRSFLQFFSEERLRCAEHVQRFSSRLLTVLQNFSASGVSGWSEMSVPTLCRGAGLTSGALREEHLGAVFVFDGKVPEAAWPLICQQGSTCCRWWHALKW